MASNIHKRSTKIVCHILPFTEKNDLEYSTKLFASVTLQDETNIRRQFGDIPIDEFTSPPAATTSQNVSFNLLDDQELVNNLVDLYFNNFHRLLPVLHKSFFYETFNNKDKK